MVSSTAVRFSSKIVSSPNIIKGFTRYYSTRRDSSNINSEKLALEHINSGNKTTYLVVNKILKGQKVSISEGKFKDLLKVKGVEFDLSLRDTKAFEKLVGQSTYKGFFGVYVFIHKATNQIYVGSSNLLRRRME